MSKPVENTFRNYKPDPGSPSYMNEANRTQRLTNLNDKVSYQLEDKAKRQALNEGR